MINQIEITGIKYDVDKTTRQYASRKIGRLDRYVSRQTRGSMSAAIVLKKVDRSHGNTYECDVTIALPEATVHASDTTLNMLAAIDIVEAKLSNQLRRYKQEHVSRRHGLPLGSLRHRLRRSN